MKLFLVLFAVVAASVLEVRAIWTLSSDGPEKISEHVNIIYTRNLTEVVYMPLSDLKYLLSHKSFDPTLPTAVYVHGWLESGKMDLSTLAVRGAYIDRGDHNVVTVDWSYYSKNINYHVSVIPQLKVIAETIAESILMLVKNGCDIQMMHLVGHSLGGQMVGKIGRHVKKLTDGKFVIPRIFALDPAGPGFEDMNIDGFEAITRTDGAYVQIIHTNGGFLGMKHRVGHVDFFPDGGSSHPGCNVDVASSVITVAGEPCNHFRSWHFYQLTVRDPKAFPAVRCDSWEDFTNKGEKCYYDDIEYMGFAANVKATGKYFLQTHSNIFNLTRGMDGIRFFNVKKTRLLIPLESGHITDASVPEEVEKNVYF